MINKEDEDLFAHNFKPRGTIAFIVLLLILAVIIWFSVYNLQVERF